MQKNIISSLILNTNSLECGYRVCRIFIKKILLFFSRLVCYKMYSMSKRSLLRSVMVSQMFIPHNHAIPKSSFSPFMYIFYCFTQLLSILGVIQPASIRGDMICHNRPHILRKSSNYMQSDILANMLKSNIIRKLREIGYIGWVNLSAFYI